MQSRSYVLLFVVAVVCCLSSDARAQVWGYSVSTVHVVDDAGRPITDLKIEAVSSDSYRQHFREHFDEATKIYWNEDLKVFVIQHGLCGPHRGVTLRFSAAGFQVTEQKLEMPLGFQGFTLKLKEKGNKEQTSLSAISCSEQPTRCVMTLTH